MKFALIAGLALSVQAGRFNPKKTPEDMVGQNRARFFLDENDKPQGTDALDYQAVADSGAHTEYCLREAKAFDSYCHQYKTKEGKAPRYADYTEAEDNRDCSHWEDGDGVTKESAHCLAQDCMFDYCLWRRDEQLKRCALFVEEWNEEVAIASAVAGEDVCKKEKGGICFMTTVDITFGDYTGTKAMKAQKKSEFKRPGWGDVYNYGNMHDDLDTNQDTDGDFESAQCTLYYEELEKL